MARNLLGGFNAVWDAIKGQKAAVLEAFVLTEVTGTLIDYLRTGRFQFDTVPGWVAEALQEPLAEAERVVGEPLFELLVRAPSGIPAAEWSSPKLTDARVTIQRMLGFATALPFAVARLGQAARAVLGDNAGKGIAEALEKLPEEIGINWALGTVLADTFEQAVRGPIGEAINYHHRPMRLEWPQLRALARQKTLPPGELERRLALAGFQDEDIPLVAQLGRQLLTVADLQQLYLQGLISEADVADYLDQLGFEAQDVTRLIQLYLERAETAGADLLRTVIRSGFIDGHLSEAQYRATLGRLHVPAPSVELEVEAAVLEREWGQHQLTLAEVKSLFQHGQLNDRQALQDLLNLRYSEDDAGALIGTWRTEANAGRQGLTVQRILSYLLGGAIDGGAAFKMLVDLGTRPAEATFLVEHPAANGGVYAFPLSPATVTQALKDQVLDVEQARAKLSELGVEPEERELRIAVAVAAIHKPKKPKEAVKTLSEPQVLAMFSQGLASGGWTLAELRRLGYSDTDSQALLALEFTRQNPGDLPPGWTTLE